MSIIGLIDYGTGKLPNLALTKLSAHHKALGDSVVLNNFSSGEVDHVYCSVVFTKDRSKAERLKNVFSSIEFGGSGWDIDKKLPENIESLKPDYDLFTPEHIYKALEGRKATRMAKATRIANAGLGYSSRGCVRSCEFCLVPQKEGKLHQVADLADIVNPRSNIVTLLDNNLTADPLVLNKLRYARENNLILNISQGLDIRTITPELAKELSLQNLFGNLHFAWDNPQHEAMVMRGISQLSEYIKAYLQTCFVLVGFDSSFEEDVFRVEKLKETLCANITETFTPQLIRVEGGEVLDYDSTYF